MPSKHLIAAIHPPDSEPLRIAYLDQATTTTPQIGIVLLLHGFPQTSHQYRHVLPLLATQGYRCIAPDYRGAGNSFKPISNNFRKSNMAADMISLLDYLGIKERVHVVGHDIGGMIAFALASRYPGRVRSVVWGECPLPGTQVYHKERTKNAVQQFHFIFHSVQDLPEALIAGKERIYITHFINKIAYNLAAFEDKDIDVYVNAYEQPGALRCAMRVYREFEEDAKENREWIALEGKCKVPTMVLSGGQSRHREGAEEMAKEVTEEAMVEVGEVEGAGHYVAEENAPRFGEIVGEFLGTW